MMWMLIWEIAMIIDKDGNQIIDESAIPMSAVMAELEKYVQRAAKAECDVEDLRKEVSKLKTELAKKQSIIDQFAQAKDEQGNIKHPHFESLRDTMGVFINSGKAKDLDQAYEMAIYSDPKLRAEMIEEQVRAEQKKKVTTNAVKNAKKVQRSQVKGSATPASPGLPSGMSIKDTIDLTLKQLGA